MKVDAQDSRGVLVDPSSPATAPADRRRWMALAVLLVAAFMDLLDGTIVFVALPRMAADLGATFAAMEWVVAGYILAFAVGLITGGRLGDIFGRKKVFMAGMAGFVFASALAGLASSAGLLIGARILQGAMAAAMVPQVLSIVQVVFQPGERTSAFALYGITLGLAAVVGPMLGGVLTELNVFDLSWRPIFLINLPIGLIALVAAARFLPESRSSHPLRLDLAGVALVTVGLLLVVFPLVEGRILGWPAWLFGAMTFSLPVFALFTMWVRRKARRDGSPLVGPSLFRERGFVAGLLVSLALLSSLTSFWFVLVLWLQVGLGYSPLATALVGVGSPLASMLIAGAAVKLAPRLGRYQLSLGFVLAAAAVGLFIGSLQIAGEGVTGWHAVPALVLLGLALGFINPVLYDFVLAAVPVKDAGSASGVVHTIQRIGGAVGIAVVGALFFVLVATNAAPSAEAAAADLRTDLVDAGVPAVQASAVVSAFVPCFIDRAAEDDQSVVPASCHSWEASYTSLPRDQLYRAVPAIEDAVDRALASTFKQSVQQALWYHVAAYLLAFGLSFLLPRYARDAEETDRAQTGANQAA